MKPQIQSPYRKREREREKFTVKIRKDLKEQFGRKGGQFKVAERRA
jgi:hypothetical protein